MFLSGNDSPSWDDILIQVGQAGADYVSGQVYGPAAPYPGYYAPGSTGTPSPAEVVVVDQQAPETPPVLKYGLTAAAGLVALKALGVF